MGSRISALLLLVAPAVLLLVSLWLGDSAAGGPCPSASGGGC